jgi:ABC-type uncharacterized transport system permease subunit
MSLFARLTGQSEEEQVYHEQPSLMERARGAVGLQPTAREEMVDAYCPQFTYKQRLYGFGICWTVGCLISLASMLFLRQLLAGNPIPFSINYTVGNLVALSSTMFLVGPARQLKRMTNATRVVAFTVFVLSMVATLLSALLLPKVTDLPQTQPMIYKAIVLACILVQFVAFFWYCLSWIPYGRRMFTACCMSAMAEG